MTKSWLKTVDAWRFERPLALLLGAAGTFMMLAIPAADLAAVPVLAGSPLLRAAAALTFGVLIGGAGFLAMRHPWPRTGSSPGAARIDEPPIDDEEEEGQLGAAEVSLRLRRSDRHPDAPARAPIFASRDLGAPFMEVGAFAAPPAGAVIPEGDYDELAPETADGAAAAVSDDEATQQVARPIRMSPHDAEPAPVALEAGEAPTPIAAFAPEDQPAPSPVRAQRVSLDEMMERLSAGLEQRAAGAPPAIRAAPRGREPALRDALEELNRLAARHG